MGKTGSFLSAFQIIQKQRLIIGMRRIFDDYPGAFFGAQASDIGYAAFCDKDVSVVLGVVDM